MFGALIQIGFSVILKITVGNLYNISVTSWHHNYSNFKFLFKFEIVGQEGGKLLKSEPEECFNWNKKHFSLIFWELNSVFLHLVIFRQGNAKE